MWPILNIYLQGTSSQVYCKNLQEHAKEIYYNDKDFTLIFTREQTRKTRLTDLDIYLQGASSLQELTRTCKKIHYNDEDFTHFH